MDAKRDANRVTTLLGVSSVDLSTPTRIAVNPLTGALVIDGDSILAAFISDAAYGIDWNGDTTHAPTKNTLYDKIETLSGVTDGDKGDITVSGTGATWTIDNGVVTLAKMADMATASLIYRKTAGNGAPEVNTLATLKTDLLLTGTNSGDVTLASPNHGLGLTNQVITLGTPSTLTSSTTNAVTTTTHIHAITGSTGLVGNATAQYQVLTAGATPFAAVWSGYLLDGTTGGKTVFSVTSTKVLTLLTTDTYTLTIAGTASISGTNTGDITLAVNHGLSLTNQVLAMGTPSSLTSATTNAVTTTTHTHAITGSPALLGNGASQYQTIITGATPFAPAYSGFLLDGTTGGKTVLAVTNTKTLTLTSTDDFNLTVPATGTAALLGTANVFTATQTISNTAPSFVMTDTTASAKSLTVAVDANYANFRESAGAAASLLVLDLANNRVGIGVNPTTGLHIHNQVFRVSTTASETYLMQAFTNGGAADSIVINLYDGAIGSTNYPNVLLGKSGSGWGGGPTGSSIAILASTKNAGTTMPLWIYAADTVPTTPNIYLAPNTGRVGMGTLTPSTILHVKSADNADTATFQINAASASITAADTFVRFTNTDDTEIGDISGTAVSGVIIYNTFTGGHYTQLKDENEKIETGMIIVATGKLIPDTSGGTEYLPETTKSTQRKEKEVFGVMAGKSMVACEGKHDEGKCPRTKDGFKHTCESAHGDNSKDLYQVFGLGTGVILVTDTNGNIDIGDYICSSNVAGYGEKQDDDILHNYTAAKATEAVDWSKEVKKTKRIACTYHCS